MSAALDLARRVSAALKVEIEPAAIPRTLSNELQRLETLLRSAANGRPSSDRLREALHLFRKSGVIPSFSTARILSFGAADQLDQLAPLIEDSSLFPTVLDTVDTYKSDPRRFRRCYRGLVHSYFSYDGADEAQSRQGRENWVVLREFLYRRRRSILVTGITPDWVSAIDDNPNLFTDDPVSRYGKLILDGDVSEIEQLRKRLDIGDRSWVMSRLIMAQIGAAITESDSYFAGKVGALLNLLGEHPLLEDDGLTLILDRYSQISSPEVHTQLRDRSVELWQNPWLERNTPKWSRVTSGARSLVSAWLKLDLINQFFELLAEDRGTDKRRVKFWGKYHESITDMYFALGRNTMASRNADVQALRRKMGDRRLVLTGANNNSNNAFIMLIGEVVVVEFGSTGNACFVFKKNALPFELKGSVAGDSTDLKHSSGRRLLHMDGSSHWESKFASILISYGIRPMKGTFTAPGAENERHTREVVFNPKGRNTRDDLIQFCRENRIDYIDNLAKGGNFWVAHSEETGAIARILKSIGCRHAHRSGVGAWYWSGSK